jgi:TatD DNase family protein
MTIDAHAHLSQSDDPVARIQSLRAMGFVASIQGGVGPEDWDRQLELAAAAPDFIKPVLGLHPWWVLEHSEAECESALARLDGLLDRHPGVVALGELGLDHFRDSTRDAGGVQHRVFERQLEIATRHELPLVLHVVHAHEEVLQMLSRFREGQPRRALGLVHAFSGSFEIAQKYLELGLKLSIGPGLAQPGRFKQLKSALPRLQPGDWVLESDGQGPELLLAARAAAGLTAQSAEEVLGQSARNLRRLFGDAL